MTPEQAKFIVETLETAIDWAEYATPYFQKKHNLAKDKENVKKAIELLKGIERRTCESCKYNSRNTECRNNNSPINYLDFDCFPSFSCNEWEQK